VLIGVCLGVAAGMIVLALALAIFRVLALIEFLGRPPETRPGAPIRRT
jgi:hypothetical protein